MIELRGRRKRKSENMLCSCCQPSTQTGIQSELRSILKTSNPAVTAVCYEQDIWTWDGAQVPSCCRLYGDDDKTVLFHDKVANGTAAVSFYETLNWRNMKVLKSMLRNLFRKFSVCL